MHTAEDSERMRNSLAGESCEGKLRFECAEQAAVRLVREAAGKVLLVTDGDSIGAFGEVSLFPKAISAVFDGDALPLFSMPDGVSRVLCAGGERALFAARYFAEVRGISCTLFPARASLDGAFEERGEVQIGGERVTAPLKEGEVVCDMELLSPDLAAGYCRLLLSRLAAAENRALAAFSAAPRGEYPEEIPKEDVPIVEMNALQRRRERVGTPEGEGAALVRLMDGPLPEWRAFVQLSALYAAFFAKGKPRRYFTPDYRARAERAGVEYARLAIPTAEEYVYRAMALERVRAPLMKETGEILKAREEYCRRASALCGRELSLRGGDLSALRILPECGGGLTAVIRDFGLMEWENFPKNRLNAPSCGV